jgi:hypothetical protein
MSEGQGSRMRMAACIWRVAKYFGDVRSHAKMFGVEY